MKTKKPDAELVWKQFEDLLAPRLHLSPTERAVYSHLFRHTRLEGKSSLRFSIPWLARHVGFGGNGVRKSLRRLVAKGAFKLLERSKTGHVVHVRCPKKFEARSLAGRSLAPPRAALAAKSSKRSIS